MLKETKQYKNIDKYTDIRLFLMQVASQIQNRMLPVEEQF